MRRILVCLVALALLFAVVAAAAAVKTYQVTGPVLEVRSDAIVVQKGKDRWELARDANTKVNGNLKVGARVTIEYRMIATNVVVEPAEKRLAVAFDVVPSFLERVDVGKFGEHDRLPGRSTLPSFEPNPFRPPDVRECVAHRTEAVAQVARKRGIVERAGGGH